MPPMSVPAPHFLLFSESRRRSAKSPPCDWRFVLQSLDGSSRLEATDAEPAVGGERLELLAVVRGLEALEQPSRVTLVTPSKYVARGLSNGLQDWRENDWNWEHHGQMVPIKNRDLWQRLDRALAFHRVQCRTAVGGVGGQGPGVRDEEVLSPASGKVGKSELSAKAAPKNANARRADVHDEVPAHAPWGETAMRIRNRMLACFRRLKASWSEMELPVGRWRIS
jgi:ribonuclease HI